MKVKKVFKYNLKKYFSVLVFVLFITTHQSQELSLMTYNIRLDVASDGENAWPNRKAALVSQLKFYEPAIFGIQEGLPHQVTFINNELKNYSFIGEGRDGGEMGEYSALYFNTSIVEIIQSGTFWLSETPNLVSKGWDAAFPRVCTYGLFKEKATGIHFFVFNTHLDHIGEIARKKSLTLILEKIETLNVDKLPVILMGDFNLEPNSEAISFLKNVMNDSYEFAVEQPFGSVGTFNAFNFESEATSRIDYIFVSNSPEIEVQKYAVLNNSYHLKYPSDHFPVFVKLKFRKKN